MAELKRIEELCQIVGYGIPDWLANKTYMDFSEVPEDADLPPLEGRDPGGHMSGTLREAADNHYGGDGDIGIYSCLFEAAERLDDAHQMWLERKLKDQTHKYIVIGRKAYDENTKVIYEGCKSADEARGRFMKDILDDRPYCNFKEEDGSFYCLSCDREFSITTSEDTLPTHDTCEVMKEYDENHEFYIDFIFRVPDVDVFVCQDDWGVHNEI